MCLVTFNGFAGCAVIFLILTAYIVGSFPTGYIAGKLKRVDIRAVGSGSGGATNVFRALGVRWAFLVGFIDISKGLVFAAVSKYVFELDDLLTTTIVFSVALGHVFPVFLKFKGGKGVLVIAGGLFIIGWHPILVPMFLAFWFIMLLKIKIMSLTNLIFFFAFVPSGLSIIHLSWTWYLVGFAVFVFISFTHRENIKRLIQGKERKLNFNLTQVKKWSCCLEILGKK